MRSFFLVARCTVVEVFQSKILIGMATLAMGILLASWLATTFAYGNPIKVALDLGLGLMELSLLAMALFMGANLISKEIRDRTIYLTIARGVSRSTFLCGKIFGLGFALGLNALILGCLLIFICMFVGGIPSKLFYFSILLSTLSSLILLNVVVFFSLFTNIYLSVISAVIVFGAGSLVNETSFLRYVNVRPIFAFGLKFWGYVLPNFNLLNIRDFVIYQDTLPGEYIIMSTLYGMGYFFVLLVISCYILSYKDLE